MKTIKDIIELKSKPSSPFESAYHALILTIENEVVTKGNWEARIKSILSQYDEMGILFIVHQFALLEKDYIVDSILSIYNIDTQQVIKTEDYNHLEKNL